MGQIVKGKVDMRLFVDQRGSRVVRFTRGNVIGRCSGCGVRRLYVLSRSGSPKCRECREGA